MEVDFSTLVTPFSTCKLAEIALPRPKFRGISVLKSVFQGSGVCFSDFNSHFRVSTRSLARLRPKFPGFHVIFGGYVFKFFFEDSHEGIGGSKFLKRRFGRRHHFR